MQHFFRNISVNFTHIKRERETDRQTDRLTDRDTEKERSVCQPYLHNIHNYSLKESGFQQFSNLIILTTNAYNSNNKDFNGLYFENGHK